MEIELQPRSVGRINVIGLKTLIDKEIGRFLKVHMQTIWAPAITTLLFYTVFALAFGGLSRNMGEIPFMVFLGPGLIMMSMAQNAFANSSSSLIIAKVQGNIVDLLMPPLSNLELMAGLVIGGIARGVAVGLATLLLLVIFTPIGFHAIWAALIFTVLGTAMLSTLGLIAGIWSERFDHVAAVTNFIVMPLTFLSGTFYSIHDLPDTWASIALFNPFFYMIDGFRYGFIGQADGSLATGVSVLVVTNIALFFLSYRMLKTGYKIKS